MDALQENTARRNDQWIIKFQAVLAIALTIIGSIIAIIVEASVVSRVWINPAAEHRDSSSPLTPVMTALPLLLCLVMQLGVWRARKTGDISPTSSATLGMLLPITIMIAYVAIGDVMRLVP